VDGSPETDVPQPTINSLVRFPTDQAHAIVKFEKAGGNLDRFLYNRLKNRISK
jgi:hypothetical protein